MVETKKRNYAFRLEVYGHTGTKTKVGKVVAEGMNESQAIVAIVDRYDLLISLVEKGDLPSLFRAASAFKK